MTNKNNKGLKSSGTLQCYCASEFESLGEEAASTKEYGPNNETICGDYFDLMLQIKFWKSALGYTLTGLSVVLRKIIIALVGWIGYKTETEKLESTTTVVFLVQYFTLAWLVLLTQADMSEQLVDFGLTGGAFSDFNSAFFASSANTIIASVEFNAIFPIIEFFAFFGLRLLFRVLDSNFRLFNKYATKKTSIQAYIDCYIGPAYELHYKYSAILQTTFVTFMYGFGVPILFPYAVFTFVVLYFVEKIMLFYSYRLPPMYDERLSQSVLNQLQFAPIVFLGFGYWMASSRQLISNDYLTPVAQTREAAASSHLWQSVFAPAGWAAPAWPLLVACLVFIAIYYFGDNIDNLIARFFPNYTIGDIEVNEEIDNYFAALDEGDRKWSIEEERNAREALGFKILTDESYDKLTKTPITSGKTLQGVHSYDILANPLYFDDFQYVAAGQEDRTEYIIDDDSDEENDTA